MKTIAIIALVASAATATIYMITSSKTCVLESQFWAFMTEYIKL